MITKPLLSATLEYMSQITYPVCVTPKIDGIRCLVVSGQAVSRTFKPIPNAHARAWVEANLPEGIDGELVVDNAFGATSSAIMSAGGTPDFKFMAFDYVDATGLAVPYLQRVTNLVGALGAFEACELGVGILRSKEHPALHLLVPTLVSSAAEFAAFEVECLALGFEGVMLRNPRGRYKCGRSTLNEGILVKRKLFLDAEATIIGFDEELTNLNAAEKDAFGRTHRSSHASGKVGAGTLGAFVCREAVSGIEFRCGTGMDAKLRQEVWDNQEAYLGKTLKFKHFPHGAKD